MPVVSVPQKLRVLSQLIHGGPLDERAFDLWQELKDELDDGHRTRLLAAWGEVVYSGRSSRFVRTASRIIEEIETRRRV